jgi:hypothetical protein
MSEESFEEAGRPTEAHVLADFHPEPRTGELSVSETDRAMGTHRLPVPRVGRRVNQMPETPTELTAFCKHKKEVAE